MLQAELTKIFIDTFVEECIIEIEKTKKDNKTDVFNFGLASAEAAVKRVKHKWMEKFQNQLKQENHDDKIF